MNVDFVLVSLRKSCYKDFVMLSQEGWGTNVVLQNVLKVKSMTVSRKGTTAPRQNEISIDTNEGFKAAQFKVEQS